MKKFPIDLSCLTEEEISQFQEDPYTLYNGNQDVALYLRYSSTGQSDQSIEGQLRDCRAFCKANHYRIVAIYVDRATTARKDVEKRVHLMEMVADSAKQNWEYVIVWKLDRFARNRNDSAIMKMRLRKNGVKVLSATEHLTDSPESIILESVLEGMAEFFSAELSQKVTRGMRESALKCHSVGGHIPLGYKVENHKLVVNPDTAHIVQEAFSLYANGESVADICRKFNSAGYKTAKNTEFNRSSFKAMFRNTRYIGTYTYKDIVIENGIPAIIDKELFETVQRRLSKTATAPARGKAKVDYLLSGKLFCGHCGASMNGESGAGRHGKVYHYYSCYTKKRKLGCDKRPLKKDYIEGIVARDALNLLTDQLIDEIADMAIRQSEQDLINDTHIPQLTAQLSEIEKSIMNITAAIEKGIASETLMNRLVQLEHEKKTLNKEIKAEEKFVYRIDRDQIVFWLSQFKYGNIEDENFRRRLIDLLVNSVTVWDEPDGYKITTAYNLTSCKTKTFRVDKNPAAEEATGFDFGESECSDIPLILGSHLPIDLPGSVFHCCITTNDEEKGRQAAQFLAEQMLSRQMQRLVMLVDKNTAAGAQQCVRALITALHGDYPRIQVLEQLEINDHYSVDDFEKLYRRYPEMQGLFIQNAGAAARISGWLHANRRDDVVVVTSQINSSVAQRMLQVTSGRMGIVSSRPIEMGHLMVYSAACALLGKPTPKYVSVDPITLNQRNVEELWPLLTQSRLK